MASISSPEPEVVKPEKKSKKDKKEKKKRSRDDEEDVTVTEVERKHKKPKSVVADDDTDEVQAHNKVATNGDVKADKKKKKKNAEEVTEPEATEDKSEKKKSKKKKKSKDEAVTEEADGEKKKKKKSKKHAEVEDAEQEEATPADSDSMDVDTFLPLRPSKTSKSNSTSKIHQPADIPSDPQFPFFTQTVSLYEPLFPIGWAQPVTNCQYQHLKHLQNKYVPSLKGVLMDYKNVAFGERPGRKGAATSDEEPALVLSNAESAAGYGWITADVDLFVPSRGAWMEGSVNLQTEGHIGVVCFGKFNASIEARRLPPSWKWVPNESNDAQGFEETASVITSDEHGVVRQIHSTGFWMDGEGEKVKGKIRFRIRNFDVGTNGETSYLSLEGTMLDKKGEKALVLEEAKTAQMRKAKKGGQMRRERRRIPEFAMTRFAVADEGQQQMEENEAEKREVLAVCD